MLTLYYAPHSRATRMLALLEELGIRDKVRLEVVTIRRFDGSGAPDPRNPHPEGKVPLLVDDGVPIRESIAILQYLADMFPEAGLSIPQGHRLRGPYLSWLAWYAGVLEPLVDFHLLGIKDARLEATFRTLEIANQRVVEALSAGPWLVGDHFTVADLLLSSTYFWQGALLPDADVARDWLRRCGERPALARAIAEDQRHAAAL